ncbi:MAG: 1-aminocyclopropane-1-carboxylate deaminase/D-cysteine desulfhydrase [Sediminibacterium sp.]
MDIAKFEFNALHLPSPIEEIFDECWNSKGIQVFVKRDDLIHPIISGNKWRKLKKYLQTFSFTTHSGLLSFGGAYSNHLYALAYAGHSLGIPTVGVIRGDELTFDSNPYLNQMNAWGMQLHFISRAAYRSKPIPSAYVKYAVISEGGFGELAIQGMGNLADELPTCDMIYTAIGTGATAIGLAAYSHKPVVGILTLLNRSEIESHALPTNLIIEDAFVFGKYAKQNNKLDQFCTEFYQKHGIPIEPIYTGRMFYALMQHIKNGHIAPYSKLVAIHTGGVK